MTIPPDRLGLAAGMHTLGAALAVLTCPRHLPVLAVLLAGTTAGAFVGEHWGVAALALTALFVLALASALRAFRKTS